MKQGQINYDIYNIIEDQMVQKLIELKRVPVIEDFVVDKERGSFIEDRFIVKEEEVTFKNEKHALRLLKKTITNMKLHFGEDATKKICKKAFKNAFPKTKKCLAKNQNKVKDILIGVSIEHMKNALQYQRQQPILSFLPQKSTSNEDCIPFIHLTTELGFQKRATGITMFTVYYYTGIIIQQFTKQENDEIRVGLGWDKVKWKRYMKRCDRIVDMVEEFGYGSFCLSLYLSNENLEEMEDILWKRLMIKINQNTELITFLESINLNDYK